MQLNFACVCPRKPETKNGIYLYKETKANLHVQFCGCTWRFAFIKKSGFRRFCKSNGMVNDTQNLLNL